MQTFPRANFDWRSQELVETYDDFCHWSSKPGELLLENILFEENKTVLDIGSGTGFPVITLAERFHPSSEFYALDIWEEALKVLDKKIKARKLSNVKIVQGNAEAIPFPDDYFDIITSNLAINNFDNPMNVIQECKRVLKKDGDLYLSTNLRGTFQEFYIIFERTLKELNLEERLDLESHLRERLSQKELLSMFETGRFEIQQLKTDSHSIRFSCGSAFLNDYFINMAFLPGWLTLIEEKSRTLFFNRLEQNLNVISKQKGEFNLSVPLLFAHFKNKK